MSQQIQEISIDLIDAPQLAMRSDINDEGIDELADSIKKHGLLQPITVRPADGRFEVIAGHRRFVACRRIGKAKISAIVRETDDREATILTVHENLLRRDVNPVDEAVFLAKVMITHHFGIKEIASLINRSETYIRERVEILDYPDYLIEAIGEKKIGLGAAHCLNKITDDRKRADYVRFAILGGITYTRAFAWLRSWEAGHLPPDPTQYTVPPGQEGAGQTKYESDCVICGQKDELQNLMLYYAHEACYLKIKQ